MPSGPQAKVTRRREDMREDILRVASELFSDKGFRATTMDELADEFGVTKQALYYYVGSKEQVLIDLHLRVFDELRAAMSDSEALADDPVERLRYLITRHVQVSTSRQFAFLVVATPNDYPDNPTFQEQVRQLAHEEHWAWAEVIADGQARGILRKEIDPSVVALATIGMVSWSSRWYRPGGDLTPAQIAEQFSTVVLDSVVSNGNRTKAARTQKRRG